MGDILIVIYTDQGTSVYAGTGICTPFSRHTSCLTQKFISVVVLNL